MDDDDDADGPRRPGRPAHQPTPETRRLVEQHAAVGTPQVAIGRVIGVSLNTLTKHYRDELDLGLVHANAVVASTLFAAAKRGNITAGIFWMRTRGGWKDSTRVAVGGDPEAPPIGVRRLDVSKLSDATLEDLMEAHDRAFPRGPTH